MFNDDKNRSYYVILCLLTPPQHHRQKLDTGLDTLSLRVGYIRPTIYCSDSLWTDTWGWHKSDNITLTAEVPRFEQIIYHCS